MARSSTSWNSGWRNHDSIVICEWRGVKVRACEIRHFIQMHYNGQCKIRRFRQEETMGSVQIHDFDISARELATLLKDNFIRERPVFAWPSV